MVRDRDERRKSVQLAGKRFPKKKEEKLLKQGIKAKREEQMTKWSWNREGGLGRVLREELAGIEEDYTENEIEEADDEDEEMMEDQQEGANENIPIVIDSTDEEEEEEEEAEEGSESSEPKSNKEDNDKEEDKTSDTYYKGPNDEICHIKRREYFYFWFLLGAAGRCGELYGGMEYTVRMER